MPRIEERPETVHIDSRHLLAEPRTRVQTYQSTPPQRVQISYSSVAPKQSPSSQTLINEDEYLKLIRNRDFVNSQAASSKTHFGYVTAFPITAVDQPFTNNEFKKYTPQTPVPSTPSSPHLQAETSSQQFVRQLSHFVGQQAHYATVTPSQEFGSSYDKDTYHESVAKTKYDPARGRYHQEMRVKPTEKVVNFKPSFQYTSTTHTQLSPIKQQSVAQSQPLHYQSVQQTAQTEISKSGQPPSVVVPHSQVQAHRAYFPVGVNHPFQSFAPQLEQSGLEQTNLPTAPQQIDNKPNGEFEFRAQYVHRVSPTTTPTPTSLTRFLSDSTIPAKYELFDPNRNENVNGAREAPPKMKLIPSSQNSGVHRPQYEDPPQYYNKMKIQPAAHIHYVPVRTQYHQSSQASPESDLLIPNQPQRSNLFVAQSSGNLLL